jgi:CheY-like chemotaxis protein
MGKRFLIIDDEPSVREVFKLMITELGGGSVHTCSSGHEALSLHDTNFDAVLLDLRMTGLNGQETFKILPPELQRRVVFVTGDVLSQSARRFIESTIRPVLIKPVSYSRLCEVVCGNLAQP